jgi:hypothetical protein
VLNFVREAWEKCEVPVDSRKWVSPKKSFDILGIKVEMQYNEKALRRGRDLRGGLRDEVLLLSAAARPCQGRVAVTWGLSSAPLCVTSWTEQKSSVA